MAFQVSPGVRIKEIDATNVVPATSTSVGGFVGAFNWGPVEKVTLISSENQLAETFYQPDENTAKYFLVAASFLKYGNALKVVRVVDSTAKNAHSEGSGSNSQSAVLVKNSDDYDNTTFNSNINWVARFPGVLGNGLRVEVCTAAGFSSWAYASQFDSAPGTSVDAAAAGITGDELHVVVLDKDGLISGSQNTVLERYSHVSQLSDVKDGSGISLFYKDVINEGSDWVRWANHDSELSNAGSTKAAMGSGSTVDSTVTGNVKVFEFASGVDGNAPTTGNIATGYDFFNDVNVEGVSLLFGAPDFNATLSTARTNSVAIANDLIAIAAARKDCMAFVSPTPGETVNTGSSAITNVKTFADLLTDSSYGFCDSGALYVYDKYNDKFRYIAASGHMAGLCANTDNVADSWFSPAGLTRGALLGVVKLAFNPDSANRDTLYKARVNPIVSMPGQGILLFGDKTLLKRASAFDRVNVRRLFIALEQSISVAAKGQLFEFNDEFTRAQFRNLVEPFLRDVKGRRGITDFQVVCDESNNTSQIIDSNQFVADIFIKPARSINFITLSFIATRSNVEFSEIAG